MQYSFDGVKLDDSVPRSIPLPGGAPAAQAAPVATNPAAACPATR
jgi:hypothetical protein